MFEFIESPIYENWLAKHCPQSSLIICSPYIKQAALEKIFDKYDIEERSGNLAIRVLIRGNLDEFTSSKSSDVNVLNMFLGLSGFDITKFRRITNLHMKAYLIDYKYLLVTSGNLTNSGIFASNGTENFEGGIATDDEKIIEDFLKYFNHIWRQSECLEDFYAEIMDGYLEYASSHKHEGSRRRRRHYQFSTTNRPAETSSPAPKFAVRDLPAAHIITIRETLNVLYESGTPLTMVDLGRELRSRENMGNLDNDVNNRKYGEEKGNLAVFFGLCIRTYNGNAYEYSLSKLGKHYLELDSDKRREYIIQQIETKDALVDLMEHAGEDGFDMRSYILGNYEGQESTLLRKVAPSKGLVEIYNDERYKSYL